MEFKNLKRILRLGQGTFGSVYLCNNNNNNNNNNKDDHHDKSSICCDDYCALKIIPRNKIMSQIHISKIFLEKQILNQLHHPHIVKLINTGKDDENIYFQFEAIVGGLLYKHIRSSSIIHPTNNNKILNLETCKYYTEEIISALTYLHHKSIIHRDIKANNIILDHNGHIKLIDFGCTKIFNNEEQDKKEREESVIEKTFTFCGTSHCLAPEMIIKVGHSYGVDMWALGIIMYEMLMGIPPFGYGDKKSDPQNEMLYQRICCGQYEQLDDIDNNGQIQDLISSLLESNSERRLTIDQIKLHPFFIDTDFENLNKRDVPCFDKNIGEIDYVLPSKEDKDFDNNIFADF